MYVKVTTPFHLPSRFFSLLLDFLALVRTASLGYNDRVVLLFNGFWFLRRILYLLSCARSGKGGGRSPVLPPKEWGLLFIAEPLS